MDKRVKAYCGSEWKWFESREAYDKYLEEKKNG